MSDIRKELAGVQGIKAMQPEEHKFATGGKGLQGFTAFKPQPSNAQPAPQNQSNDKNKKG